MVRWARPFALVLIWSCGRLDFDATTGDPVGGAQSLLRLDRLDPGEVLVDFPLPVVLDDAHAPRDLLDSTASNLRFLDADGNVLASEIEQVGASGGLPLVAWVRVPQIVGTSTTLAIEFGGTLPTPSVISVWGPSYEAVYHLSDGATDATANHHDGAVFSASNPIVTIGGAIASCQSFANGPNAYVIPDSAAFDLPQLTVSGWIQSSASNSYHTLVGRSVTVSNFDDFWLGTHAGKLRVEVTRIPTTDIGFDTGTVSTTWTHLAMTADSSELTPYIDGVVGAQMSPTGADVQHDPTPIVIGADEESSTLPNMNFLDGAADEIRIEHGVRSAKWIRYDDQAQRDLVISYGTVGR